MIDNNIGTFTLHRKLMNSQKWRSEKPTKGQAWVHLISGAEYKHTTRNYRGTIYEVARGQILVPMTELATRWGWDRNAVRRFLKALKLNGDIEIHSNTRITLITILNYDQYQPTQRARKSHDQVKDQVNSTSKQPEFTKKDQVKDQVPNLIILKREKQTTTEEPPKVNRSSRQTVVERKGENRHQSEFKGVLDPYAHAVNKLAANPGYRPAGRQNYVPPLPIRSLERYKNKMWQEFIIRQQWGDEAVASLVNSMKETITNAGNIVNPSTPKTSFNWVTVIGHDGRDALVQTCDPERDERLYSKTEFGQTVYYKRSNSKCKALAGGN